MDAFHEDWPVYINAVLIRNDIKIIILRISKTYSECVGTFDCAKSFLLNIIVYKT